MKAGKRIIALLVLVLTFASLLPMKAEAIDLIDRTADVSLEIFCNDGGKGLPNAQFKIYQVATLTDRWGTMALTGNFSGLLDEDKLNSPDVDWTTVLNTIVSNMSGTGIQPEATIVTAGTGKDKGHATYAPESVYDNAGNNTKQGLYLVVGNSHDNEENDLRYHEQPFLVMLPNRPLVVDGKVFTEKWDYSVFVDNCKHVPEDIDKVIVYKDWDLHGYHSAQPSYITVRLYAVDEDGVEKEVDSKRLSAANDWSYTWTQLDHSYIWRVREDPVPGFKPPTVSKPNLPATQSDLRAIKEYVIYITNEYIVPPKELPQTGLLWWPVPVLLTAGMLFVLVGLIRRRGEKRET